MRAVRRDEAICDRAAGFQQFACYCDVDIADAGREREHGALAAEVCDLVRKDFNIISRGAGPLCDTPGIEVLCTGKPACAAADTIHCVNTPPPSPPSAAINIVIGRIEVMSRPRQQPPNQPITFCRSRCMNRSRHVRIGMISAR